MSDAKIPFLYIASSSYSGSTLLAFLLNAHPEIFSVSEMHGWEYSERETFHCSCGQVLSECRFFRHVSAEFARLRLPFDFREFGTRYRLVCGDRLNRYLTSQLPRVSSTPFERVRDVLVMSLPPLARRLAREDAANLAFIRTGLAYGEARVFVDGCKNPFRLRHLRRIAALDLRTVHLVRDVRGFVLSNKAKWGWPAAVSARMWLQDQADIVRIAPEVGPVLTIHYEDLCDRTDETLARIHRFIGVEPHPFCGDFKAVEHHILGNWMRHAERGVVTKDTRWEQELPPEDIAAVTAVARRFVRRHQNHPLTPIIRHYLTDDPDASVPVATAR